mmetsp:Transcript_12262/g.23089  ORF Transcript_12262/g.23089 Transcript_12262/m.23089 type:complete len:126 (+) Transcript_12262:386-763(+)
MEEFNRKHRALKCFPLRTLHQNNNNVISKRKRNTQENGECTLKRLKNCHFDNATTMDLDTIEGRKDTSMKCIFCRKWSGSLEDFAWHVSQAHGIPAQVAKCIMNKLVVSFSSLLLPPFFGLANFC